MCVLLLICTFLGLDRILGRIGGGAFARREFTYGRAVVREERRAFGRAVASEAQLDIGTRERVPFRRLGYSSELSSGASPEEGHAFTHAVDVATFQLIYSLILVAR